MNIGSVLFAIIMIASVVGGAVMLINYFNQAPKHPGSGRREKKTMTKGEFENWLEEMKQKHFRVMVYIYAVIGLIYFGLWTWVLSTPVELGLFPLDWRWIVLLAYPIFGLLRGEVDTDKIGALISYGYVLKVVEPGLKLTLPGIVNLETVPQRGIPVDAQSDGCKDIIITTGSRNTAPFNAKKYIEELENIEEKEGKQVDEKKFKFIHPWNKVPVKKGATDPLMDRLEITFRIWFRFKVEDPFLFFTNVRHLDGPDGATEQMIDGAIAQAKKLCGLMTPAEIIANLDWLRSVIKRSIEFLIREEVSHWRDPRRGWGLDITDFEIRDIKLPEVVGVGLTEVSKAALSRQASIDKATAIKNIGEAEGEKIRFAERAKRVGMAQGLKEVMDELEIDGETAVTLEIVPQAINQGDLIIGMEGISQVVGLGKALGQQFNRTKKETKKEKEENRT